MVELKMEIFGRYNCFCHVCGKEIPYSEYRKNVRLYDMGCCNRCVDRLVNDKKKEKLRVKYRRKKGVM